MTSDWTAFLVLEVEELLTVGRVGLFEFFDILRSQNPGPAETEWTNISEHALALLLTRPDLRLYRREWSSSFTEPADGAVPTAADWQTPTEKPYLALDTV